MAQFADLSLPVPVDQAFTYAVPAGMASRIEPGIRAVVPFAGRQLTGVVLKVHDAKPDHACKAIQRLVDDTPVIDDHLRELAQWIASYYCSPLGEVLRAMTPLTSELRKSKQYSVTDRGRESVRQLLLTETDDSPALAVLRLLEARPLSANYLAKRVMGAEAALKALVKKGLVELDEDTAKRDPLRAPAAKLRAEFLRREEGEKLTRAERETIAYLELHPGSHNLAELGEQVKDASTAARALARRGLVRVTVERGVGSNGYARPKVELNNTQKAVFDQVRAGLEAGGYHAWLLQGVTGSGKTEVYMRLIDHTLSLGKNALMLVPEIGLTPAVAGQFFHRFGDRVAILHSAFSDTERVEQWRRIRTGAANVVVGTRSGVFAPVPHLGLIVVDEEHDQSYKQEETPRYHGRDVAVVRGRMAEATVVLGSATPSLESRYNADQKKYGFLRMPDRVESRPLANVTLVDMREEFLDTRKNQIFSRAMLAAIEERLKAKEQTMIMLNRRGYSSVVTCRSCGERVECQNCALSLTFHKREKRLMCHYCGYTERVPEKCPKCNSDHIYFLGTGSEKVEAELTNAFPDARIARMDRDTVTNKRDYENILHAFRDHEYDILVGTQMIAKGHDIPNVTFVGVVSADIGLGMPDFRAAERVFQLLTQAAGRAGRGTVPGSVLVQTLNPEHYAVRFAAEQDYEKFYEKELEFRRLMRYPPYAALANLIVRSQSQEDALRLSGELGDFLARPPEGVKVLGPAEAPVSKLKTEFRYQVLLKSPSRKKINEVLLQVRERSAEARWPATALVIDVDPYTLM